MDSVTAKNCKELPLMTRLKYSTLVLVALFAGAVFGVEEGDLTVCLTPAGDARHGRLESGFPRVRGLEAR